MRYYLKIFGCQMNYSDAERISTILEKYKFKTAASIDAADFVIFVTCGVRQSAENRVYGQINNIRKKYPRKYIILTGCLAHRKDVKRRLKSKVDLFFPISDSISLISLISQHFKSPPKADQPLAEKIHYALYKIHNTKNYPCNDYLKISPKYTNPHTAYIPIMTGCNNFCAYCVVPYARGREYSRPAEDILKEVRNLVKKGYKEIFLLGQNVNSYNSSYSVIPSPSTRLRVNAAEGSGLNLQTSKIPPHASLGRNDKLTNFPKLLKLIEKIPGNFWLTFLTSHPKDMSDELIDTMAKSKKICEYINLPAQSGDDEILRKMNRNYTIAHYKNLIKKIRKNCLETKAPTGALVSKLSPTLSTDIIVGFPGETKKQFENTCKLFREMKFDMAYINQYSPRPETAAWKLKDNVGKYEKNRREQVLTEILKKTALTNNKKYIGKTIKVLVDKEIPRPNPLLGKERETASLPLIRGGLGWGRKYLAHTRTQKKVIFHSNKKIPVGNFVKVKITKAKTFGLEGEIK